MRQIVPDNLRPTKSLLSVESEEVFEDDAAISIRVVVAEKDKHSFIARGQGLLRSAGCELDELNAFLCVHVAVTRESVKPVREHSSCFRCKLLFLREQWLLRLEDYCLLLYLEDLVAFDLEVSEQFGMALVREGYSCLVRSPEFDSTRRDLELGGCNLFELPESHIGVGVDLDQARQRLLLRDLVLQDDSV